MTLTLTRRFARFARSKQGERVIQEARRMARDPKTRRQIDQVRERLEKRDRPGAAA